MDLAALLASVIVSVGTVGAGYLVARRFQRLGGGEAQERLNSIRKELDDAMSEKLRLLGEDFAGCKLRLVEVEGTLQTLKVDHEAAAKRWSRERIDLKQEIGDLHDELRTMRPDRRGAKDRTDD